MTRSVIEITFGNAMAQANQLDQCAETMEQLIRGDLVSIKDGVRCAWEGEACNAYISKMDLTSENMAKTAKKIRDIADTLRRVARIFRDTELRALAIAEQRTFGS